MVIVNANGRFARVWSPAGFDSLSRRRCHIPPVPTLAEHSSIV
jgi:hypothetical protein